MGLPFFSILICNYNYGCFVHEAVESCLAQRYPAERFEVIVVDDGSTDDSREVLARYAGEPNVILINERNAGQAAAFAAGLARARGDYVCLLDSDDVYGADKLAHVARYIGELAPRADKFFLCHDLELVELPQGRVLDESWFQVTGVGSFGDWAGLSTLSHFYPFAVPCGQIYGRALLERVMEVLPLFDWRRGADAAIAQAALMLCGRVHYLGERLGRYRVHGGNHFAGMRDGRFRPHPIWRHRWPKQLRFLEALVDSVDFDDRARNERLAYLGRLEQTVRAASSRHRYAQPRISFIVDAREGAPAAEATLASIRAQTHPNREVIWICGEAPAPRAESGETLETIGGAGLAWFEAARCAHAMSRGDYFVFVDAGDRLDPTFAERHLHAHQYTALVQVTCCDFRLVDAGEKLVQLGVMVGAGRWKPGTQHIPPFAAGMREWPLAPLCTCVFRRTPLLDVFFALRAEELGAGLDDVAGWLLAQYALCLGGAARLGECLIDFRVPATASASQTWLLAPCSKRGPLAPPDFAKAAHALFGAYCRARSEERAYLPAAWEQSFARWLLQAGGPHLGPQLEAQARTAGIERLTISS